MVSDMSVSAPATLAPIVRDHFSTPFFEATAQGRLLLRYSPSSGEWSEPAARVCALTQADDLEWREAAGTGRLVSWTVKTSRPKGDQPGIATVIGVVELDEGPWLTLQLPEVELDALQIDLPVRIGFVQPEGSEHLPVAHLA
jgi:uncharacterized OB-fold protein